MKKITSITTALLIASAGIGNLVPLSTSSAEPQLFTHHEWTGKEYTDRNGNRVNAEDVFAINREGATVNAIPYQSTEAAVNAVWDYNARCGSDYMQMLTGAGEEWQLNVVQNASQAQKYLDGGFMNSGYSPNPADGWKNVELPKSWTCQDFDFPIYANVIMPWQSKYNEYVICPAAPNNYNPVGLYRKNFTVDSALRESGRRVYIEFDGVESAYYVYLNGKEVGYSEDTFSPHRFDITDYLKDGENTLAVEVHKFCDGTWFEGQDMIYDGGIFRDVFLVSTPDVRINDYTVRTDLDDSYKNSELQLSVDIANITSAGRSGWTIEAAAYDESGNNILSGASGSVTKVPDMGQWSSKTVQVSIPVTAPKLWSAEDPNLYALVLTLKDDKGNVVENVSTQLGFREIGFTSTQVDGNYKVTTTKWDPITINGKRLLLKGVNRHDTDPFNGKAVPQETIEEDIRLMQENNINAVRTSHYSNDSYLYWLCNKYGMYVMGETNMESHALMSDNDNKAKFYELAMDRTETAYKRLKNNPSIVAWSIGNEMAYTSDPNAAGGMFRDMIWYFKKNDPTRPVHSEGQGSSMGVDMNSNMYPGSEWLGVNAGDGKIPYVMCEYDHAMGNSLGALKEYWDVIRSSDNMMGGFIWDWADQSRAVSLDTVNGNKWDYYSEEYAHKNLYSEEIKGKYYAYGGDWGDNPNDNSFCQNGIVSPDRDPQPEIAEVKYQYQNFWFTANDAQLKNHEISVYNENNFTNLSEYDVSWELLKNGIVIDSGVISDANVAPLSNGTLKVPYKLPQNCLAGDEFYLNISVCTKYDDKMLEAGYEISYAQFKLSNSGGKTVSNASKNEVVMTEGADDYIFAGKDFSFAVNKNTGLISKYTYNGDILMTDGPSLNFWRGYVENDTNSAKQELFDPAWEKALNGIKVDGVKLSNGDNGTKIVEIGITLPSAGNTKATQKYTISGDGSIKVDMSVDATSSGMGNFLRVGSMMTLPEGSEQVSWYGNGPVETFNDRKTNGRQGIWSSTVSEMFYPYMKADDTGNLTDIKWISVRDSRKKSGLLIAAEGTVEGSALHFRPSDFSANHVYELSPRKETLLSIDYGSMGTGSATCGQGTLSKYRLPSNKVYSWSYTIIPTNSTESSVLADKAAKLRSDGISIQDKSRNNMIIPVGADAKLKTTSTGNAITGALDIPFNSVLNKYVEGKKSFTIEANIVPTGDPEFNMIAGKGDSAFALRTRKGYLDFFIYADGGWKSLYCAMSTDAASGWIGKKHQVAGVYDAEKGTISVYADGKMLGEQKVESTSGVSHSDYDLTIGACPETGRSSQAEFYEVRLYSKALTAAELASQNTSTPAYAPDSKDVQLWLDFDNTVQGTVMGDVNSDGKVNTADLVMLQKWVLGSGVITDWTAGDLYADNILDCYDVVMMRKMLLEL